MKLTHATRGRLSNLIWDSIRMNNTVTKEGLIRLMDEDFTDIVQYQLPKIRNVYNKNLGADTAFKLFRDDNPDLFI